MDGRVIKYLLRCRADQTRLFRLFFTGSSARIIRLDCFSQEALHAYHTTPCRLCTHERADSMDGLCMVMMLNLSWIIELFIYHPPVNFIRIYLLFLDNIVSLHHHKGLNHKNKSRSEDGRHPLENVLEPRGWSARAPHGRARLCR